jgi:signal transduction histidine kinase
MVALLGLLLSLGAFIAVRGDLDAHQEAELEWVAHNRINAVKKEIKNGLDAVQAIRDLLDAADPLTPSGFERYAQSLLARHPGIHSLAWIPAVSTEVPLTDDVHAPIIVVLPDRKGAQSFGLEDPSGTIDPELTGRARDSGQPVASTRIPLSNGNESRYGFKVFQAIYRIGVPTDTQDQRRAALRGFAVGVFRIDYLVDSAIEALEPRGVELFIRDESAPPDEAFLEFYASRLSTRSVPHTGNLVAPEWDLVEDARRITETFTVADRLWSVTCSPTRRFRSAEGFRYGDWAVLIGGLLLTLVMTLFVIHTRTAIRVRMSIEQELRESEQKLRVLFHQSPDIILTVDRTDRILMSNRPRADDEVACAVGQFAADMLPERIRPRYHQALDLVFRSGDAGKLSLASDDSRWWELRIVPLRVAGSVIAAMIIITDVTDKRMLEIHAIRNARLASLGVLAASVAHEINNPNNAIQFNASILTRSWEDILSVLSRFRDEHGDFMIGGVPVERAIVGMPRLLAGIDKGSRRIHAIVGNLKHMAQPDEGELDHRVDLADVLEDSLSVLQSQVRKHCDDCRLEIRGPLPPVQGNHQQLEQVFINLILNALQSLPDPSARVRIGAFLEDEGELIRVSVRDEGCGIPEAVRGRVLDPFFTTKKGDGGTGLGLSISYRIIQNHGGRMEIISTPEGGTEVLVRLPACTAV